MLRLMTRTGAMTLGLLLGCATTSQALHVRPWEQRVRISVQGTKGSLPSADETWSAEMTGDGIQLKTNTEKCGLVGRWSDSTFTIVGVKECRVVAADGTLRSTLLVVDGSGELRFTDGVLSGRGSFLVSRGRSQISLLLAPILPSPLRFEIEFLGKPPNPPALVETKPKAQATRRKYDWEDTECAAILEAEDKGGKARNLMCPFDSTINGVELSCPPVPDEIACKSTPTLAKRERQIKFAGSGLLLPQLLVAGNQKPNCSELFEQTDLAKALAKVKLLTDAELRTQLGWVDEGPTAFASNPIQKALGTVLARSGNIVMCNKERIDVSKSGEKKTRVHAQFNHLTGNIVLYATACRINEFDQPSTYVESPALRFLFALGHELGHAIDVQTGDFGASDGCRGRETRASIYGTYVAQCYAQAKAYQAEVGAANNLSHSDAARKCLAKYYRDIDAKLGALREDLRHRPEAAAEAAELSGCALAEVVDEEPAVDAGK